MSLELQKNRVGLSVTNCICFDQRVLKMAEAIRTLNCEITIIGRRKGECCNSDLVPFRTHRFRMLFKRGFFFYKFFNIRLFFYLLFHRFDLLVANDLDTLLPNYLISKIKGLPLVYDSHEYFTGVPEIQNRPFVKWVWKSIEKIIFPKLNNVLTVSDSIADKYNNQYGLRPLTVRNCSAGTGLIVPYSRRELNVNDSDLLLIMQGTGINVDRGGEELIEAVNQTKNVSLLIVGSGDLIDKLKNRVAELGIQFKVKFISKVPWKELMRYTKSADIGLTLDKNNNDNYNFSLPNKLFDYINSGIPVIASNLPEVKKLLLRYKCGVLINDVSPEDISSAICELRDNPSRLAEMRAHSIKASAELNWEIESEKIKALYISMLSK
jgi:glycosyltransferase involved in cell wall biosynthesis